MSQRLKALKSAAEIARRALLSPLGFIASAVLVAIIGFAIVVPIVSPYDANTGSLLDFLKPPSPAHLMGTDSTGRDIMLRMAIATRVTILAAMLAVAIATAVGVSAGVVAGYFQSRITSVITWVNSLVMALPGLVVLLAASVVLGNSVWTAMVVIGLLMAPSLFRLTYSAVTVVRNELYIDAAKVFGISSVRIIWRHVLRVVQGPLIVQAGILMAAAIAAQGGLQFLGLSDPLLPNWGSMLNEGFSKLFSAPLLLVWPTVAIAATSLSFVFLSNAIRDQIRIGASRAISTQAPKTSVVTESHTSQLDEPKPGWLLDVDGVDVEFVQPNGSVEKVVRGVSLQIAPGESVGIVGESGSGKTQTARALMGLLARGGKVAGGKVKFEGQVIDLNSQKTIRKIRGSKIGYIPQEPMSNLDPSFTIGWQLTEPLRYVRKLSKDQATKAVSELLVKVGFADPERILQLYPHELSGGMAQRVLIVGAVALDPVLIIADEPTTALDVSVQAEVLDLLRGVMEEKNIALLLVTHNLGVVADIAERVYVFQSGQIVESGSTRDVLKNPRAEHTKQLLASLLDDAPMRAPYLEGAQA
jgi:ABC-type dipeptide/oligopeptide/nickel transport system ATPase component/ABC-type dipeptide/oligopeptide/nickel transport system permease subunit